MKQFIAPAYTFTPGASGVGTVDLSGIVDFNAKYLVSIINQTRGTVIYSTASPALKYTNVAGTTVTLFFDTSTHNGADVLQVIYEEKNTDIPISTGVYYPDPLGALQMEYAAGDDVKYHTDGTGNLAIRGAILTDEGSLREDFAGASISSAVTGNMTFTNGSDAVTGTGFLTQIRRGQYVKLDADATTAWEQVFSVDSNTSLTLFANYSGTGGTGASSQSVTKPIVGTGGSIAVATSFCTITSGATTASITGISREIDYGPLMMFTSVSINQRVANLTSYIGLQDVVSTTPAKFARFVLTGTTNTTLSFETASVKTGNTAGASDTETTSITLSDGLTTASSLRYKIEISSEGVNAYINDKLVARHLTHIPEPYDIIDLFIGHINGTTPSTTNLVVDMVSVSNFNSLKVTPSASQDKFQSDIADMTYYSGSVSANNTDFFVIDCNKIRQLILQVTSIGGGGTYSFQCHADPTFPTTNAQLAINVVTLASATSGTGLGIFQIQPGARYVRVRTTAYTSGTLTIIGHGLQTPMPPIAQPVIGTLTGVTTVTTVTTLANGQTAHSAASTGSPLRSGGRVSPTTAATVDLTLIAGDAAESYVTTSGQRIVKDFATRELDWQYAAAASGIVNTTTAVTIKALPGTANVRNYITAIQIQSEVLGAATEVAIRDGAGGSVLWRLKLGTAAQGLVAIVFPTPIQQPTANALLEVVTLTASVTGAVYINVQGYVGP